jgi:flagellar basal-body rod modification protein FlgD
MSGPISSINAAVSAATGTSPTDPSVIAPSSATNLNGAQTLAGNFDTFLQLLTTQLKNQNPLDPLDTNQFTQQLVQFAGVEQQINMNTQLGTLISLQQSQQTAAAIDFVGKTVAVDGTSAQLSGGQAIWTLTAPKPASATITITSATGQTVYSGTTTIQSGTHQFAWNGMGNNGTQWPDGSYTLNVTAQDTSGQTVAISTEVDGTVESVDLTNNPPVLSVGGQTFPLNKIKRVTSPGSALSSLANIPGLSALLGQ